MPKPKSGVNGSGMHINMSLSKDGHNIFDDPEGKLGLSREARYFIGGLLAHMKGMSAITNPLINSYKRLVPGYEAPCYIAWSAGNRSPLIRIPSGRGEETRIELRSPDPAANPYLTLAVCLAAGLDGIKKQIEPPTDVPENIYAMDDAEREDRGIESLPSNLHVAIKELKKDSLVREVLGEHITRKYTEAKEEEWKRYREQVSAWEIEEYLYKI
jgi:glutamine synthetase